MYVAVGSTLKIYTPFNPPGSAVTLRNLLICIGDDSKFLQYLWMISRPSISGYEIAGLRRMP